MRLRRKRFPVPAALALLFALTGALEAHALVGELDGPFGLDANFRSIAIGLDNFDFAPFFGPSNDSDFLSLSLLRATAGGRPSDWLSYEIHAVQSINYSTALASPGAPGLDAGARTLQYQAFDFTSDWHRGDDSSASLFLDRLNFKLALDWGDVTLGRQAVTFGKAYFWNPLDIFLPFDPRQFDRDYKTGVDAARLDLPLGDFSGWTLVGALGREIRADGSFVGQQETFHDSWFGSALLARGFTTFKGWDFSFQAGKVYGGYQLGTGLVGELGPVQVRAEAAWLFADSARPLPFPLEGDLVEDHLSLVLGGGHHFENSLQVDAEYFYNGVGETNNFDVALVRFHSGGALNLSRHLVGLLASYQFTPLVTGQLASLLSLNHFSAQFQPSLTISVSDEIDFLIGAIINTGPRPAGLSPLAPGLQSEFGAQPNVFYAEFKIYF